MDATDMLMQCFMSQQGDPVTVDLVKEGLILREEYPDVPATYLYSSDEGIAGHGTFEMVTLVTEK